jgi:hypothetical protein
MATGIGQETHSTITRLSPLQSVDYGPIYKAKSCIQTIVFLLLDFHLTCCSVTSLQPKQYHSPKTRASQPESSSRVSSFLAALLWQRCAWIICRVPRTRGIVVGVRE